MSEISLNKQDFEMSIEIAIFEMCKKMLEINPNYMFFEKESIQETISILFGHQNMDNSVCDFISEQIMEYLRVKETISNDFCNIERTTSYTIFCDGRCQQTYGYSDDEFNNPREYFCRNCNSSCTFQSYLYKFNFV